MVKNKKDIIIVFLILLILGIVCGTIYYKVPYYPQQKEKTIQQDTEIIGQYILDNINSGKCRVGEFYYLINISNANKLMVEGELVKKAVLNTEFIYGYTLDKDTVLLSEGATFQTVSGYIITNSKDKLLNPYTVPDSLGYDAPIWIEKINDHLYRWTGGV